MRIEQAIETLRNAGVLETVGEHIRYRGPKSPSVDAALDKLRRERDAALSLLADGEEHATPETLEAVLKGRAIELWSNGERYWLVADEEDVQRLGERRGDIYTAAEARHLVTIRDPSIVREIHTWKRATNGVIRGVKGR